MFRKVAICTGLMIGIIWLITGPFYNYKKLSGEPVEKLGICLNQMARVVAYDGNMNKKEKEFMDNLLPLEYYEKVYTPADVDNIKWHDDFNEKYLDKHLDDFNIFHYNVIIKIHASSQYKKEKEIALSWWICLYDLCGDDIVLKREWLKTNILDFFDHLTIKKIVIDRKNKEIEQINRKSKKL